MSSGEAEFYAAIRGASEGLGLVALLRDLGWDASFRLWVDSSAAKAIASRAGLGKLRRRTKLEFKGSAAEARDQVQNLVFARPRI